jgi:hypothetical protein
MPRKTHVQPDDDTAIKESILDDLRINLPKDIKQFLGTEVTRLNIRLKREGKKDKLTVQRLIRALIISYCEKRAIGLKIDPDD